MNITDINTEIAKSKSACAAATHSITELTHERAGAILKDDFKTVDRIDRELSAAQSTIERQRERQELL